MYDPSDDGDDELDFFNGSTTVGPSSTCYPEASDSCVGRTDNEQPENPYWYLDLGYPCWPETGVEGLEGETGARGPGKWIRRLYSHKQWRGQKVLFRWHVSPGGVKGYQHCATGPGCGNRDDGWFIDDIRLYGRANPIALTYP